MKLKKFMKNNFTLLLAFLCLIITELSGQSNLDFDIFQYRYVGPDRGGRVTAVTGVPSQPSTFYMGATGGGVWKTEDYGTSWKNISDGYFESPSIGAIQVAANDDNIIYVGTGSDGLRSNVIGGKGVYKSIDAGKTWRNVGLKKTGHIGAVEIHPENNQIAFVAAIGQAFNANEERGIYRTKDGGENWEQVLFLSDTTGFADLEFMPSNPNIIYAAAWRAERKPWTIISGGKENGIYKSINGGDKWERVGKGLPELMGKIDLAVSPSDSKVLYALVEAPAPEGGLYRSDDQGRNFKLVSKQFSLLDRPFYYCNVEADPQNVETVYVMATQFWKSSNGGKSWKMMSVPHGDNHDIWINPENSDLFVQANDGGANVTHNGGKTWSTQFNQQTAELYQVEVDNQHPYWLYAGQQDNYSTISVPSLPSRTHQAGAVGLIMDTGGCETGPAVPNPENANIVYSNCKGKFSVFDKITGQERRYDVGAAYMYGHNPKDLKFRFQRVSPIHVSPHDASIIYHCSQFVHKTTDEGKTWEIISPDLTAFEADKQVISGSPITRDITGEEFYSTIYSIRESSIEKGVLWVGANDGPIHVSKDGGANWSNVTPKSIGKGGRVDSVEPSPHEAGSAYVSILRYQLGDWKPYIYKTENYGKSWKLLTTDNNGIPNDYPIRVIRADPNKVGLLYAGTEYGLYISFDDGKNWQSFQQNLPITPITDIKIHRKELVTSTMGRGFWIIDNLNPLYQNFEKLDLAKVNLFQPKDTYRYRYRSFSNSRTMVPSPRYPRSAVQIHYLLPDSVSGRIQLEIINEAGKTIRTYTNKKFTKEEKESRDMATNEFTYTISTRLKKTSGLHTFLWDMRHAGAWDANDNRSYSNGPYAAPGNYKIRLTIGEESYDQDFELMIDPRVTAIGVTQKDILAQEALGLQIIDLLSATKRKAKLVEDKLKALKKEDTEEKTKLEALKKRLVRAKGRYTETRFINQVSYLFGIVNGSDHLPGRDAYERYEELKKELEGMIVD